MEHEIKGMKELIPLALKSILEANAKSECPFTQEEHDRFLKQIEDMGK